MIKMVYTYNQKSIQKQSRKNRFNAWKGETLLGRSVPNKCTPLTLKGSLSLQIAHIFVLSPIQLFRTRPFIFHNPFSLCKLIYIIGTCATGLCLSHLNFAKKALSASLRGIVESYLFSLCNFLKIRRWYEAVT